MTLPYKVNMELCDVAVVGGSFAGLACAQAAALRGLRTVVLERKSEPGAAVHTTGLLVKEAADELGVPERVTRKISGVRLYAPSLRWIDLESPGYYFLATDTPELLRLLACRAERAGADLRCGSEYTGARVDGERISVNGGALRARFLVGADGPRSRVARDFSLGTNRKFLIGVEAEYDGVRDVDPDRLHCFIDSQLAPGYIAWVIPGVSTTQIGLACSQSIKPDLPEFIRRISRLFNFDSARLVGRRGGLIPIGGRVAPVSRGGALLIGDAAGIVSPLTAGGIHTALCYGRHAGDIVSAHLLDGGPDPGAELAALYPRFFWKKALRAAYDLHQPNWTVNAFFSSAILREIARAVFFHHRGLFSIQAWRELLRLST